MIKRQQIEPLMTTQQVAKALNIHPNTVRRWGNKGILPHYRISNRGDLRFRKEDVDLLLFEAWLFDYDKVGNKASNNRLVHA